MLLTVREPARLKPVSPLRVWDDLPLILIFIQTSARSGAASARSRNFLVEVLLSVLKPALLMLCLAAGFRLGGGLVWAYNVKSYFVQHYCSPASVGRYLSWVPLVGGTLGAVFGGLVSDKLVQRKGPKARLWVLILSQLLACPFLVGAILLPPDPWAFLCLLPAYIVGEVWIGVCLAVVIELVPHRVVAAAIAVFLFVINNIGGAMPLLVPVLEARINLRYTLLILFPGMYLIAASLFCVVLVIVKCTECSNSTTEEQVINEEEAYLIQVGAEPTFTVHEEILESQEALVVVHRNRSRHSINSS